MPQTRRLRPIVRIGQRVNTTETFRLTSDGPRRETLDLSDAESVAINLEHVSGAFSALDWASADIVGSGVNGEVEYTFTESDTTTLHGDYYVQFEVTYTDGSTELVPPEGYDWLIRIGRRQPTEPAPLELSTLDAEEATIGDLQVGTATINELVGDVDIDTLSITTLLADNATIEDVTINGGTATINALTGSLGGTLDADGQRIANAPDPQDPRDLIHQEYADQLFSDNNVSGMSNPATEDFDLNNYSTLNGDLIDANTVDATQVTGEGVTAGDAEADHWLSGTADFDTLLSRTAHTLSAPVNDAGSGIPYAHGRPAAYSSGENVTYVVYRGPDADPYIVVYDHGTDDWDGPYQVGVNPLSTSDGHGPPSIVIDGNGYLNVAFGSHGGPIQFARTTAPHGYTDWTQTEPSIAGGEGTYPSIDVHGTDIYIVHRTGDNTHDGTYPGHEYATLIRSQNGGDTWEDLGPIIDLTGVVDYDTADAYVTSLDIDSGRAHVSFFIAEGAHHNHYRKSAYHIYYNISDGTVYAADGTSFGNTLVYADLPDVVVFQMDQETISHVNQAIDNGAIHMLWCEGRLSNDPVRLQWWYARGDVGSTTWTVEKIPRTTGGRYDTGGIRVRDDGTVEAHIGTDGEYARYERQGGGEWTGDDVTKNADLWRGVEVARDAHDDLVAIGQDDVNGTEDFSATVYGFRAIDEIPYFGEDVDTEVERTIEDTGHYYCSWYDHDSPSDRLRAALDEAPSGSVIHLENEAYGDVTFTTSDLRISGTAPRGTSGGCRLTDGATWTVEAPWMTIENVGMGNGALLQVNAMGATITNIKNRTHDDSRIVLNEHRIIAERLFGIGGGIFEVELTTNSANCTVGVRQQTDVIGNTTDNNVMPLN